MDDAKIVQLYWDRDTQAIAATSDKYGTYCSHIARNILSNEEDTEECVNDTYLNVWNSIPPHRPQILSAYLGKIVRNLAFNRHQYNTAAKRGSGTIPAVLDELAECVPDGNDVSRIYDQKELSAAINNFLASLPAGKRKIFVCRYWYSDSISDIAARFGMSSGAVSMTLNRLRQKLRIYLNERGYTV